jgi:hypothetical protein
MFVASLLSAESSGQDRVLRESERELLSLDRELKLTRQSTSRTQGGGKGLLSTTAIDLLQHWLPSELVSCDASLEESLTLLEKARTVAKESVSSTVSTV